MTHGDIPDDGGMDAAEFAKLMGGYPDPPMNPLYQTGGGFMDNPGGFAWVSNAESSRKCDCGRCERGREGHYPMGWTCEYTGAVYHHKYAETFEATPKWECDECGTSYGDEDDAESCCIIDCDHHDSNTTGYGTAERGSSIEFECNSCGATGNGTLGQVEWFHHDKELSTTQTAETFEAPYGGAGALMDIGKDTPLAQFTDEELTKSSAIHGDFDTASIDYSGHQNIEVRAETFEARDRKLRISGKYPETADTAYFLIDNSGSASPGYGGGLNTFKDAAKKTIDRLTKSVKKYVIIPMNYDAPKEFSNKKDAKKYVHGLRAGGPTRPLSQCLGDYEETDDYTFVFTDAPLASRWMRRADTDAYTYAYTEGHSDSRKKEGFHPSMDKGDSKDFHQILRQKAEMESLTSDIVDVSNRIGETVGRVRVQDDKDDMEDVFVEVENEDGDVIMEGKLEDEWTPNMEDLDYYYGESFESPDFDPLNLDVNPEDVAPVITGGMKPGMIGGDMGGSQVAPIMHPTLPEEGNGEGGNGESTPEPAPEEGNGGGTEGGNGDTQEDANGGSDEGQQEEEQQGGQPPPHEEEQQGSGGVDALAAEAPTSFLTILLGTTATLIGLGLLSKKLKKKAEFHNETDEPTEEQKLIMNPNIGDLDPAQYEELVVESTGYAVDVIPMGLDGSFMGSRFNALPTDRFIDYNEPGIGAHIDIALTRNENFREPEQSMVQASETEVKETQAPGQSPYFQMGHEPVDMNYRVLKETTTVSLDPAVRAFIPQSMSGYTGQKYAPPSVYEKMFGLGVSGITPAFVSGESDMGANRFGSRDALPDRLSNIGGPLSDSVNAGYTDGTTSKSLAQWSIENQVQAISDTEAIVIDRASGARKMIRRV